MAGGFPSGIDRPGNEQRARTMNRSQPGILGALPSHSRYLSFALLPGTDPRPALAALRDLIDGDEAVVGVGAPLVSALAVDIPGLRDFPVHSAAAVAVPSTPSSLWCWLRGEDPGVLLHRGRALRTALASAFRIESIIDGFLYREKRDLTGYEDGTENPTDDAAAAAALVTGGGPGINGSSFVAVQKWVHDLDAFAAMSANERDHTFGRRISDNEELDDAPEAAHVKRTAQESFDPTAFVVRRSVPWADAGAEGLVFVAFGKSFDAFEALLGRMVGAEDGIVDALFRFTRPVSGSYYWCPPMVSGRLNLTALGI